MIQIGWWLGTNGLPQREAALGFNEVALERGWLLRMGMDPSFHREECDAHVVGTGLAADDLSWLAGKVVVAVESDLTASGIPSVHSDYAEAGRMAAEHLLGRGLRYFAGFGMNADGFWIERCRAFREAVERAGARYCDGGEFVHLLGAALERSMKPVARAPIATPQALHTWLESLPSPIGILAGADAWGRLLLPFVLQAGRQVPNEVAVLGVDNDEFLCELTQPSLSSVSIPWRRVGRQAGLLIERLLAKERVEARRYLVPPAGIIARRSTDMLAVADREVAAALAFIQGRYQDDISVADVLRAVPTYRKRLEGGFRRHVGHGIMREIRRMRVEQAKQLLIMTDMPLEGVAKRTGFVSAQKMTEFFSRIVGMPPSRFRRQFQLLRGGDA